MTRRNARGTVPCTILLAQGKAKREAPSEAGELYISPWFLKARAWALERVGDCLQQPSSGTLASGQPQRVYNWAVLSAKHGLLNPSEKIHPYEQTLTGVLHPDIRRAWARRTALQILKHLPPPRIILFLAGKRFREFLMPLLENSPRAEALVAAPQPAARRAPYRCYVPLQGLGIGQQMRWMENTMDEVPMEMELDLAKLDAELAELSEQQLHEAMLAIVHEARQSQGTSGQSEEDRALLAETKASITDEEREEILRRAGLEPLRRTKRTVTKINWEALGE